MLALAIACLSLRGVSACGSFRFSFGREYSERSCIDISGAGVRGGGAVSLLLRRLCPRILEMAPWSIQ